ncbi:MAG TPA: Hsp20/alpha crystallin family protein [Candidatus Eisenbacteria bacterium]|jgi:HSP20 family protein|nr:Hsp20/alpha crystallin family protein [Candidatus Eisenbacteria bacterium]HEU4334690.1 Hsp20/alpha crystallin family protein [Candidatus Eisenbacteria bacterium]
MRALVPATGMTALKKEMDRIFDRIWETDLPTPAAFGEWTPVIDVLEGKDELVVKVEVPGIEPKEISLTLAEQVLTINGEKKYEKEEKDEKFYRMERAMGAFSRSVRLPIPVDINKVAAVFKNGLLTVTLPKSKEVKGTAIPIKYE